MCRECAYSNYACWSFRSWEPAPVLSWRGSRLIILSTSMRLFLEAGTSQLMKFRIIMNVESRFFSWELDRV